MRAEPWFCCGLVWMLCRCHTILVVVIVVVCAAWSRECEVNVFVIHGTYIQSVVRYDGTPRVLRVYSVLYIPM